jgi:hypothetical protein
LIAGVSFFVYYGKNKNNMLTAKLISDVLNAVQQGLIGAYTGAAINVIAIAREIIFYHRGRWKWADHRLWLWLFIVLMGAAPLWTWNGAISLLPCVGSILAVIAFYMEKPTSIRALGLGSQTFWLLYSIFTVNLGAILQNIILIFSAILGLFRDRTENRRIKNKQETDV